MPVVVPTKESVAARIRELLQRQSEGNQSEFARRCGLDRMDVYRYVRAENMPGAEHLARIAQACSVSVDWNLDIPGAVNGISAPRPDEKIEIPSRAVALVDFEAVRRFVAGEELGTRSTAAVRIDSHMRLVDAAEFATVQQQLDDAAKAKGRRRCGRTCLSG